MNSPFADGIVRQLGDVLPSEVMEQIGPPLSLGLAALEQHGDQQSTANVQRQVSALCKALKDGDHEASTALIAEWGVLASAFGIDAADLVGKERGELGTGHVELGKRVAACVGSD